MSQANEPKYFIMLLLPKARSDLLMFAPSRNLALARDDVTEPFSDPARSIIDSLATLTDPEKMKKAVLNRCNILNNCLKMNNHV